MSGITVCVHDFRGSMYTDAVKVLTLFMWTSDQEKLVSYKLQGHIQYSVHRRSRRVSTCWWPFSRSIVLCQVPNMHWECFNPGFLFCFYTCHIMIFIWDFNASMRLFGPDSHMVQDIMFRSFFPWDTASLYVLRTKNFCTPSATVSNGWGFMFLDQVNFWAQHVVTFLFHSSLIVKMLMARTSWTSLLVCGCQH